MIYCIKLSFYELVKIWSFMEKKDNGIKFFREDRETIDYIEYDLDGKINKIKFFQQDGETIDYIEYYTDGKKNKIEFFEEDGGAIDYIGYYIGNKLDFIEMDNLHSKKLVTYNVREQNLAKEIGSSFVNHKIEIKKNGCIETNRLKEKVKKIECGKHKIINFSIEKEGQSRHRICIAIQNKEKNKTFAIIDSNGYKENSFTYSELTIEKYKEILGVKGNDSLVYLKNSIQKGGTCVINAINNARILNSLIKKSYSLKDIIVNYNNLIAKKTKKLILAAEDNFDILAAEDNFENKYKKISDSIMMSESLGAVLMTGAKYNFMKYEKENSFFIKKELLRKVKNGFKNFPTPKEFLLKIKEMKLIKELLSKEIEICMKEIPGENQKTTELVIRKECISKKLEKIRSELKKITVSKEQLKDSKKEKKVESTKAKLKYNYRTSRDIVKKQNFFVKRKRSIGLM